MKSTKLTILLPVLFFIILPTSASVNANKLPAIGKVFITNNFSPIYFFQRTNDPIPLIDVVVRKTPPGNGFNARSDRNGYIILRELPKGYYVVTDKFGNKGSINHRGGNARWRLMGDPNNGKPVWTLIDESNPL
ncbi:MAG: carboxypeptidase regulatory-like domain-containing protein [Chitinophagaceae bacterium]|nr:MAG: carboxypeptidase regulatory-like domain-containing protein [Chitinophagaceae bacterium]